MFTLVSGFVGNLRSHTHHHRYHRHLSPEVLFPNAEMGGVDGERGGETESAP